MEDNPFRAQPDEKIFTFKEEEKKRRQQEREKLKELKIWDRSNPVREGIIRKIQSEEATATEIAKRELKKNKIDTQGDPKKEKISKTDDRYTLIDKKRDMFLMKMMMDIKNNDIQKLEEYARLREDGLECSHKMLEEHLNKFDEFLERNKRECDDAVKMAERKNLDKTEKTKLVKEKADQINYVKSLISKAGEQKNSYLKYKVFIREIISKSFNDTAQNEKDYKEVKSSESEEVYSNPFKTPNDLYLVLKKLEEENVRSIVDNQLLETNLEQLIKNQREEENIYKERIAKLQSKQRELEFIKGEGTPSVSVVTQKQEESKNELQNQDENMYNQLTDEIRKVYRKAMGPKYNSRAEPIEMCRGIEKKIEERLDQLKKLEEEFGDKHKNVIEKIEEQVIKERRSAKKAAENEEKLSQNQKDSKSKESKKSKPAFVKTGRPDMCRSQIPLKKAPPKKSNINEEEEKIKRLLSPDDDLI